MKHDQLTAADIRRANKMNALSCLLEREKMTIAQLAKECGATIVTMGKIVQSLVDAGLVAASINDTGSVGRHGLIYELNLSHGVFVCFDVTFRDRLLARTYDLKRNRLASFERGSAGGDYFAQFCALADEVNASCRGRNVLGVGLSTAGVYDKTRDRAASVLFDWYHDVGFSSVLRERFLTHNILIGQDISFAALAQSRDFSMKPEQSLYYLYVGDGISGVFIKNGRMHEGVDGLAKNPGKMLVTWGNRLARVEQVVSGEWQREEGFAERMRPLFTAIYNVLWLLDPDYFVIAANDLATARRLCDGAVKFASLAGEGDLPLSTKFVLSDNCDASQTGILQKLIDRYLRAV